MNTELYIHTLRTMRGQYEAEHMETETEALDAAIQALQTQTEVFVDGTLSITVEDISQIRRVLVSQSDTQYGTLFYADGKEYDEGWKDGRKALREEMWEDEQSRFN